MKIDNPVTFAKDGEVFVRQVDPRILRKSWDPGGAATTAAISRTKAAATADRYGRDLVITSEHIDRDCDIVRSAGAGGGMVMDAYMRNPIVQLQHGEGVNGFPVIGGNAILERTNVEGVPGWMCREWLFGDTQLGRDINSLWNDMILRTASVGFVPLEWFPIDAAGGRVDPMDPDAGMLMSGFEFTKSELREFSIVAVPANPYAARKLWDASIKKARQYFDMASLKAAAGEPLAPADAADASVERRVHDRRELPPQEVARVLKTTTLERCPGCNGLAPYTGERLVDHRRKDGPLCETKVLSEAGGPSLKTIADSLRDQPHGNGDILLAVPRALVAIAEVKAYLLRLRAQAGEEYQKAGRVLSAETRRSIEGALGEVEAAAVQAAEALDSIQAAAGTLREFMAGVDQPPAPDMGASASASEGKAAPLLDALADPRVTAALARFKA